MKARYYLSALTICVAGLAAATLTTSGNLPDVNSENTFVIAGLNPAAGSTVRQLASVTMLVNSNDGEFMVMSDPDKISDIILSKEDGTSVAASGIGEFGFDEETFNLTIPVEFPVIMEAGVYTLTIPEGVLVEAGYDSEWNMIPAENGKINAGMTATITVDPMMKGKLEDYIFAPESGSFVTGLDNLKLLFPELPMYGGFQQSADDAAVAITNGTDTYAGYAGQDWSGEETCKAMKFYFDNGQDGEIVYTPGKWTLSIQEGAFEYEGEKSPAIEAWFTVISSSETTFQTWNTFPNADTELKSLRNVRLMFMVRDAGESINVNSVLLEDIRLLRDGKDTWTQFEIGEPSLIMNDMVMMIPLVFDSQSMPGEYELVLPEGLFYQTRYNEATGGFDIFDGYQLSALQTIGYKVSQDAEGLFDDITFTPAAGCVQSLDNLSLTFNSIPSYLPIGQLGFDDITLVKGDVEYVGAATSDTSDGSNRFGITFMDDSGNPVNVGAGEWKLTIPEGYFMFDSYRNAEITAVYDVCPVVLSPASGSILTEITGFEVSFPRARTARFVGSPYMITLVSGQSSGIPTFDVTEVEGAETPTFRLTPPEGFAEPSLGYLAFNIEEGAFLIDGKDGDTVGNSPRVQASYIYERSVSREYIPEPNAEEVLCNPWGYTVGFVFDSSAIPSLVNYGSSEGIDVMFDDKTLRIGSENQCYAGEADCSYAIMDNIFSVMVVNPEFHKEGVITVSMSGGAYRLSGTPGFDVTHSWRVVMPREYEYSLSPEGGERETDAKAVSSLDEIILVFGNAETAELFMPSGISLRKDDYSLFMTAEIEPVEDAGNPAFRLKFQTPDGRQFTSGMYELQIRFDTFTLDGVQTWPANYTDVRRYYNLDVGSGVDGECIDGEDTVTVISADGRIILKDTPANSIGNLGNGIYIVNGKTTVVRK